MAKNGTIKEFIKFSLIGSRGGKQAMFKNNVYDNDVLLGTSDVIYEEVTQTEVDDVSSIIDASKAKTLSGLIKGNNDKINALKEQDKIIAGLDAEIAVLDSRIAEFD